MERIADASPRLTARIAAVFYVLTFVAGGVSLSARGRLGFAANIIGDVSYIAVTFLFYHLFKPVGRNLSLLAAVVGLVGCAFGLLRLFHLAPFDINPLVIFGVYCLLIGYLIFASTFLPRILGVLMALGGVGWLTFLSPTLAHYLSPYNFAPGMLGEGALTLWLLVVGLNAQRWIQQASFAEGEGR